MLSAGCMIQGAVLMDAGAEPRVTWEFEALLVLLSGHWPARGLLSGHWPPLDLPDGPTPKVQVPLASSSPHLLLSTLRFCNT